MKKIIISFLSLISLIFLLLVFYAFFSKLETENIVFTHKSAESKGDKLIVLRIEVTEDISLELSNVNANQKSQLLGNYGEYALKAIYPLLKIDKRADSFVSATFSHSLKILVSRVIALESIPEIESPGQVRQFLLDLCLGRYGEISFKEKLRLIELIFRTSELNIKVKNLAEEKELSFDENSSDCSVALINTTAKNGLGKNMAQMIENNGFRVVKIDDISESQKESKIFLAQDEERCRELAKILNRGLPTDSKPKLNEDYFSLYRADIVILLGTDLIN